MCNKEGGARGCLFLVMLACVGRSGSVERTNSVSESKQRSHWSQPTGGRSESTGSATTQGGEARGMSSARCIGWVTPHTDACRSPSWLDRPSVHVRLAPRRMPPNVCAQAVSPVKGCAIVYQLYGDTQKAMIFTPIRTQEMSPRAS